MPEARGIFDGMALILWAVEEALQRCQYKGNFYSRVGGVQGLTQLLTTDNKELRIRMIYRGIGPKTALTIKTIKHLIMEAVAENAEHILRAKGHWKEG